MSFKHVLFDVHDGEGMKMNFCRPQSADLHDVIFRGDATFCVAVHAPLHACKTFAYDEAVTNQTRKMTVLIVLVVVMMVVAMMMAGIVVVMVINFFWMMI